MSFFYMDREMAFQWATILSLVMCVVFWYGMIEMLAKGFGPNFGLVIVSASLSVFCMVLTTKFGEIWLRYRDERKFRAWTGMGGKQ